MNLQRQTCEGYLPHIQSGHRKRLILVLYTSSLKWRGIGVGNNSITANFETRLQVGSLHIQRQLCNPFFKKKFDLKILDWITIFCRHSLIRVKQWFSEDLGLNPGSIVYQLYTSLSYFKSYFTQLIKWEQCLFPFIG